MDSPFDRVLDQSNVNITGGSITGVAIAGVEAAVTDLIAISATMTGYTPVDTALTRMSDWPDGGFNMRVIQPSTSWYNEVTTATGNWLGEAANETAARLVTGAGTGSYYHNTTNGKFYSLDASSGQTEIFRGSTKAFPEEFLVVAEAARVILFDATDPAMPMWKVATTTNSGLLWGANNDITSVAIFNGYLYVGHGGGAAWADFVKDEFGRDYISSTSTNIGKAPASLADWNGAFAGLFDSNERPLVDFNVNDVAITVLSDAPIDPATGMQVPTIAVATDGGVSQIGWDGVGVDNVWDQTYTVVTPEAGNVWITNEGQFGWLSRSSAGGYVYNFVENRVLTADKTTAPDQQYSLFNQASTYANLRLIGTSTFNTIIKGAVGLPTGLTHLKENPTTPTKGAVLYTTTSYPTGYMVGDIRSAWLADTTAGALAASSTVADRSVKNNPLTVFGSGLTKAAVAAGSDLMGYSGFSATDYLQQPYNADLGFGTGEFAIPFALKMGANTSSETVLERDSTTTGQRFTVAVTPAGYLKLTVDDGTTTRQATGTVAIDDSTWRMCVAYYDGAGGVYLYVGGVLYASQTGAALLTMNNATAVLRIGATVSGTSPLTHGSLALLRIGATAPSADQIAWIYAVEKFWFQDNATVTLPGSSDAIVDLDYDEGTGLHHILTSYGHSVFDRGRMIESTAGSWTKVTANNGLVVRL